MFWTGSRMLDFMPCWLTLYVILDTKVVKSHFSRSEADIWYRTSVSLGLTRWPQRQEIILIAKSKYVSFVLLNKTILYLWFHVTASGWVMPQIIHQHLYKCNNLGQGHNVKKRCRSKSLPNNNAPWIFQSVPRRNHCTDGWRDMRRHSWAQ